MRELRYLAVAPCDAPLLPDDLFAKLYAKLLSTDSDVSCVRYNKISQPTFSLWHKERSAETVSLSVGEVKDGSIKGLLKTLKVSYVDWPECLQNPFYNVNTPADLENLRIVQCH